MSRDHLQLHARTHLAKSGSTARHSSNRDGRMFTFMKNKRCISVHPNTSPIALLCVRIMESLACGVGVIVSVQPQQPYPTQYEGTRLSQLNSVTAAPGLIIGKMKPRCLALGMAELMSSSSTSLSTGVIDIFDQRQNPKQACRMITCTCSQSPRTVSYHDSLVHYGKNQTYRSLSRLPSVHGPLVHQIKRNIVHPEQDT